MENFNLKFLFGLQEWLFFLHQNFVLNARDVMPDLEKIFILEFEFLIFIFFLIWFF